jgi:Glycosyl transferase family 2
VSSKDGQGETIRDLGGPALKIAFLNPWRNAAENQAFRSLQRAAARIGHEFVQCCNSDEVDACQPDFVLAAASTQPKLNDVPHYGVIHEPRDRFLTNREYFLNLLTYDGYLTIADSLERFLRDISYSVGRSEDIGFYYNTCQKQERTADLPTLIRNQKLIITYFGTNWDHRRSSFFRQLSEVDSVQICGPAHAWPEINPYAYGGTPDFDGDAVQARYAANGIGLCLLSDLHLRDDIVTNRIFEITSVGAIAICCGIPWIRKHYGDSVYYVDQSLPDRELVRAIQQCRLEIYANPAAAIARARAAREIFETRFAAELLIDNAVRHHQQMSAARLEELVRAKAVYEPRISVIIRCGGRPLAMVGRALQSLAQQTYGRFEVVFVRYQDLDLGPLVQRQWPNIASIKVLNCYGSNRSATLWAGLSAIDGEYFSILDDDDWLFSTHFERLFQPFPTAPRSRFFAFSGSLAQHVEPKAIMGGGVERRELFQFQIEESHGLTGVIKGFTSNCFVASKDLLYPALLNPPPMRTAEDSFLILSLLARAEPHSSYAGTSVYTRGRSDQSDFANDLARFEDELTLHTRLFGWYRPSFAKGAPWADLNAFWRSRPQQPAYLETSDRIIYRIAENAHSMMPESVRDLVSTGYDTQGSQLWADSYVEDPDIGVVRVQAPEKPWSYGAALPVCQPGTPKGNYLLVVEIIIERGEIGVGLLNAGETDFLFRQPLKPDPRIQEVHIPVLDFTAVGRLVVQNWQNPGESIATVLSIKVFG